MDGWTGFGVGRGSDGMFMYIKRGDISWETIVMVFDIKSPSFLFFLEI